MDNLHASHLTIIECLSSLKNNYDNFLLPMKANYFYDFLAESNGKFFKIKTVFTTRLSPSGSYVANIRKSGGYNPSNTQKAPFDNTKVDYLFISSPIHKYLIPATDIKNVNALSLNSYDKYIIPG